MPRDRAIPFFQGSFKRVVTAPHRGWSGRSHEVPGASPARFSSSCESLGVCVRARGGRRGGVGTRTRAARRHRGKLALSPRPRARRRCGGPRVRRERPVRFRPPRCPSPRWAAARRRAPGGGPARPAPPSLRAPPLPVSPALPALRQSPPRTLARLLVPAVPWRPSAST